MTAAVTTVSFGGALAFDPASAGTVNNHNATAVDERAPFGGVNQSGVGRELGREGLLGFTETHVMAVPEPTEGGH